MNNIETASLVLSTLINNTQNDNQTMTTWNNLNLKTILGTMYDKYDKFNIELVTVLQYGNEYDFGYSLSDLNALIQLSGLSFVNNNYSSSNNHNINSTLIGSYQFITNGETNTKDYKNCVRTFIKNSNYIINLTITYVGIDFNIVNSPIVLRVDGANNPILDSDGDPTYDGEYPEMVFMFNIYGIPNDKNNHNGSRMLISN
jgi:hypothetical protein